MKLNGNFAIKKIAGDTVAIYCDKDTADFRKAVSLKGSAELLFEMLSKGADKVALVGVLLDTYDITEEQATRDVDSFLQTLDKKGLLDR